MWDGARPAVAAAARDIGVSAAEAELLAPNGPRDLAALMARHHDALGVGDAVASSMRKSVKIRERIRHGGDRTL